MRIILHKLVVSLLVFGLIAGSMSLASSLKMNGDSLRQSNVTEEAEVLVSLIDVRQSCDPQMQMINCAMTHAPLVSAGMSCCGCFLSATGILNISPLEIRVTAFGKLDVTGNSRAPTSLLKPPRA